ncbi:MAG: hypothetical protein ACPGJV_02545 [Bacteriovoracaceae bacterium]
MNEETQVEVQTEEVVITVGKETKEVVDALNELVKDIRAKKEVSVIAVENLPTLLKAVEGVDQLANEMKSVHRDATIAYSGMKISEALLS